jgi:hypothetical protein
MLIQRQLIQHWPPLFATNKSAPCKRKFRGALLFRPRARIATKFILPRTRARAVIPFFAYFGNGLASASRFFVSPSPSLLPRPSLLPSPLLILSRGDAAPKICVTVTSCSMIVDKYLTLTDSGLGVFTVPVPQWQRRLNTVLAIENSMTLMGGGRGRGGVTIVARIGVIASQRIALFSIFLPFDFDGAHRHEERRFPSYYSPWLACPRK